jgi:hydrophobic/amphiphilic exporter-1 (mainly G- bacteria), HAE1 family
MRGALTFVTRRPVAISMFVLAMAVFGFVSFSKLSVDLLPEISYPTLTVRTTWSGAAPEDIEERVSEKVQESLSTLDNLVRSTSISRAGVSDVVLDFDWGTEMTFAVQDVREALDTIFLPGGADRPLILRYDPNLDPILRIGIRVPEGREPVDEKERIAQLIHLRWFAENRIKRDLESMEGIAAVQVRGGLEEEIRVRVDPHRLAANQIDPGDLANRLAQENINAAGGRLLEGSTEYLVRTVNQFLSVEEIEQMPVARRGEAVLRVADVGTVERTFEKREVISRIGGAESVEIAIYREAGANIVQLAQRLKHTVFGTPQQQAMAERFLEQEREPTLGERSRVNFLAWRLRQDVQMETLSDQSVFIDDAVNDVKNAAILGALFAIGVIWVFLRRPSATFIVGVSIPISIVVTFAPMFIGDVSLNIMSLGGLALGVGMLVDNAIVVLESITRCREEGDTLAGAAVRGVSEVAGAVIASTLTTIAVFAPIVFVTGIAGQIFGDQALTVVSALAVSLLVAVLFIPMLASRRWLVEGIASAPDEDVEGDRPSGKPPGLLEGLEWSWYQLIPNLLLLAGRLLLVILGVALHLGGLLIYIVRRVTAVLLYPIAAAFDGGWGAIERIYPKLLGAALRRRFVVVSIAIGLLGAAAWRLPALGVELLPEIHQGEFTAHVKLKVGSPLERTDEVLRALDERVLALPEVAVTALTVGVETETLTREIEGPYTARLTVRLEDASRDPRHEEAIAGRVREILLSDPAVQTVEIVRPTPFAIEAPIAVEVRGYDLAMIEEVGGEVRRRMEKLDTLADVRSTVRPGHPEARITFDRDKILELGLDLGQVAGLVRDQVQGAVPTRFHEGDERIDIRVIGDEKVLSTLEAVRELPVNPASETSIPLRAIATVEIIQGPAEIRRIRNTRAVVVSATGKGLDLGGVAESIEEALASMTIPEEVTVELGGQKREMDEAQRSLRFALLLAVFLVYVVMASQFESLLQPFIILLTVPLAGVGVVLGLDLLRIPLSVVVFVGAIMLAGIVVNNAIVLIDRINQKRDQGLASTEAILEAGSARLRPIMMTTATTVLGLLPLTGWLGFLPVIGELGAGEGAEIRAPMAVTVIIGLITSTLLTLLVIPVVYSLLARHRSTGPAVESGS